MLDNNIRQCSFCGRDVKVKGKHRKNLEHIFCNQNCYNSYRKKSFPIRYCANCNKEVEIKHKKRLTLEYIFCCKKCEGAYRSKNIENNCKCDWCGKEYHVKPNLLDKYKKHYCSMECHANHKKEYFSGENNHQYGVKGSTNATWKSDFKITNYGYKKIRVLNHPFRDCDDFVFEHRLVAEKYLLNDNNSIEIDGVRYLNPELEVHHIDEDKLNNRPENLQVLTKSEHSSLHWKKRK